MDDNLQSVALVSTFFTLACAGLVKSGESGPEVTGIILLVNTGVLFVAIYQFYYDTWPSLVDEWKGNLEQVTMAVDKVSNVLNKDQEEEAVEVEEVHTYEDEEEGAEE